MGAAEPEPNLMRVSVHFYSYCKELAGCATAVEDLAPGSSVGQLLERVWARFPKLKEMERSLLIAVGVDYQKRDFILTEGDEVSLFPPVQGG